MRKPVNSAAARDPAVAELMEIARSAPKVAISDDGSSSPSTPDHARYRDNFCHRFIEVRAVLDDQASRDQIRYVRMVKERFGFDLLDFYERHTVLCDSIVEAIRAAAPYELLVAGYADLSRREEAGEIADGSAEKLNLAAGHPLGIEAIGAFYSDAINPLLESAYELMKQETLNAPFLTK